MYCGENILIAKTLPLATLLLCALLAGCTPTQQLLTAKDSAPLVTVDPATIKDAIPRQDLITRAGNKNPYTVLGKTYQLIPVGDSYIERGVASWYGTKFHGRNTANGERYNLYAMTAAHTTLPIPSYVKVTNLDNNRSTVVRVNDRGPFHGNRIIDLSYAAAVKLGYAEQGTARVEVELIDLREQSRYEKQGGTKAVGQRFFLQVGAFKSVDLANQLRAELKLITSEEVNVSPSQPKGFYRVKIGPITGLAKVQQLSERLMASNMGQPRLIAE